jgi:glycosyltransferase involved in cell wall biosynthesis
VDVTVCVGTFGDSDWGGLAQRRAIPSAEAQGVPVVHRHASTLAAARNEALEAAETDWVIFLDADDELAPGYVDAMDCGDADIRGPMAVYLRGGRRERLWQPRVAGHRHDCHAGCLPEGNWLLIGSAARTDLLREVGGWRDFEWSEDWDTWLRCYKAGATFELVRGALYRAHVRPDSRNRGATREAKLAAHRTIYEANFGAALAA